MTTEKFLNTVLGSQGSYCIFAANPETKRIVQKFYPDTSAVVNAAIDFDEDGYNTYFGLATFNPENSSRETSNIISLKAFFLDLDCGLGKDFDDQKDAINKLRSFCKELNLPKPLLVNSGRGVHVYWVLDSEATYQEWFPVADKLKRKCRELDFPADPSVTSDGARILRIPNTHNYKQDPPLPVGMFGNGDMGEVVTVSLEDFSDRLGFDLIPVLPSNLNLGTSAIQDALLGNTRSSFKKILDRTVAGKGCEQIKHIILNQAEVSEPLWRAGLSIAKFCEEPEKIAIKMSKEHPEYSTTNTLNKMAGIKGPYLCEKFDEENPDVCKNCPHFGKIKSPISLGKEIAEAEEEDNIIIELTEDDDEVEFTIPKYPAPYFRGKTGGIYIRIKGEEGEFEDKLIYHNDLYVVKRIRDVDSGENIVMRLHLPRDGAREFTMPLTSVTSREEFRKHLAMQGVAVLKMDQIMAYVLHWVHELQASSVADDARRQFGWVDNATGFVLGDRLYKADRVEANHPSSATAQFFSSFAPKGTLEGWKETINFYNRTGMELHQYVVCTGFGSALMQFVPRVSAAGLHIFSKDSGLGKTTAMAAACTIWGLPDDLLLDDQDTKNFKMNRGEIYKNIPLYLDEVTNTKPEELSALAYQLTSGRQRGRLSSSVNQERSRGEPWSLLSVSTGNTSFIERISAMKLMPKAEQQRILEMRIRKFDMLASTKDFNDGLASHYGHAGPIFIQAVLKDVESTKAIMAKVRKRVEDKFQLTAENRFWSAHITCTLTGAIIARKLGLIKFSIDNLFDFCHELVLRNKAASTSDTSDLDDILNDYMNENMSNILEIDGTIDKRLGAEANVLPNKIPRGALIARLEPDTGMLYLVPNPLKAWCIARQLNYNSFLEDLTLRYHMKRTKIRLGKGTNLSLPPTNVLALKVGKLDFVIGDDDQETEKSTTK